MKTSVKLFGEKVPRHTIVQAVVVAATAGLAGELAFSFALANGAYPPFGYLILCGGLTYLATIVIGGLCGAVVPRIPIALAIWAGLNAWLCLGSFANNSTFVTLGISTLTVLITGVQKPERTGPALGVGFGLVALAVVWPRSFAVLKVEIPRNMLGDLSIIGSFGTVLFCFWAYSITRRKYRWMPSEVLICGSLLIALAGGTYAAKQAAHTRISKVEAPEPSETRENPSDQPSIIVLVLDTVRADHLSLYGYHRDTTPALRRFVKNHERSQVYPLAFSPSNWTLPAHASLFTGQIPSVHGIHLDETGSWTHSLKTTSLRADRTLAEALKGAGYRTAAILANTILSHSPGLKRGFDVFEIPPDANRLFLLGESLRRRVFPSWFAADLKPYPSAAQINNRILKFLDASDERPSFVVANYMEAHAPYAARRPFYGAFSGDSRAKPVFNAFIFDSEEQIGSAKNRYDEEIFALDADLEQLFLELHSREILENSWIVITSDHGESFGEHGVVQHMSSLYNEQVRIPLVLLPPSRTEIPSLSDAVSLIDVASTLAAIAKDESFGTGRDLRSKHTDPTAVQIEFFGADDTHAQQQGPLTRIPARAVVLGQTKMIDYPDSLELFKMEEDPTELRNLEEELADRVLLLAGFLPPLAQNQDSGSEGSQTLSLEQQERLRALGYLD